MCIPVYLLSPSGKAALCNRDTNNRHPKMRFVPNCIRSLCVLLSVTLCLAQTSEIAVEPVNGRFAFLISPYRPRYVPPARLTNSQRLNELIRAGNLYLSARDVVAL